MEVPRIGSDPSTQKELAGDPPLTDLATAGVWVLFTHLPHPPGLQRPALFLGYLLQLVRPFQKVLFLYLAVIEVTIHLVRHSSLQPLLELLFRVRFVVWLPRSSHASSIPRGAGFLQCMPVLSTSSNFVKFHLCQLLAHLGLVSVRGLDVEARCLFDQSCSILNPQD